MNIETLIKMLRSDRRGTDYELAINILDTLETNELDIIRSWYWQIQVRYDAQIEAILKAKPGNYYYGRDRD